MATLNRRGIPAAVLYGRERRYIRVANLYKARLTQELMRLINREFWIKAEGMTDSQGEEWEPLKESTIKHKLKLNLDTYDRDEGKLSPADRDTWERHFRSAFQQELRKGTERSKARRIAKAEAWNNVPDPYGVAHLINIRTGRLVAATAPGTVAGGRYYSPADQNVVITSRSIHVDVDAIPYANAVQEGDGPVPARPFIPDNLWPYVSIAHDTIIDECLALYLEIKDKHESNKNRARSRKRQTRKKRNPKNNQ